MTTLRFSLEEMQLIRNVLYSRLAKIKEDNTNTTGKVRDIVNDTIEEHEKLICYLSDKISREEPV